METILEAIGHTPIVQLRRAVPEGHARLFAKLERFNPGGSLKDRVILKIITDSEKGGALQPGNTIVAATTGNSGIALGYIGAVKKYRVVLTMPEDYSLERRRMLEGYGVEVHLTPASEGMSGAIRRAQELARTRSLFMINQFEDPRTVEAHAETTASEIETALARPVDAFVATFGTGGTLMGTGHYFKKKGARLIAIEPARTVHKIQGTSPGFPPPLLKRELIDQVITVSDRQAYDAAQEVARREGILVGLSSGAAFHAARKVARELGPDKTVVTVFPDGGERYLSLAKEFQ